MQGRDSSGKSTLLRLMAGAYTGFSGDLLLDDAPLGNYHLASVRSHVGVLINQQDIFHGTVLENISLGNENISMRDVIQIATQVGLATFIAGLKMGYDTVLDPTGKRLPRSIVHKILLVRALAGKPRLLLLEEPWQDPTNADGQRITDLLMGLENTTLVVVTNDESFAKQCDKIMIIKNGTAIIKTNQHG